MPTLATYSRGALYGGLLVGVLLLLNLKIRNTEERVARAGAHVIVVPGGGQDADGGVPGHMKVRLDKAHAVYTEMGRKGKILVLSGGTPHKPNPKDDAGFCVKEAESSAKYLMSQWGVPAGDILEEAFSLDTLGNAYFARVVHTDVSGVRNVIVVNNRWHMPRTRAIFELVFGLPPLPTPGYALQFIEAPDGLDPAPLAARQEKEAAALASVRAVAARVRTLPSFHTFLFTEHAAYAVTRHAVARKTLDPALARTY